MSANRISAAEYHADPCPEPSLSSGIVRLLCSSSPAHAWTEHPRLNPDYRPREDDKFDIGSAAHALLLEGNAGVVIVEAADWRTKAAQETKTEARAAGLIPLLGRQWDAVQAMVAATHVQLAAFDELWTLPFSDGTAEHPLFWEEDGVHCRALLDFLHTGSGAIDDYKTTSRTANPEQWSRTMFGGGYDVQAAWYLRGLRAVSGTDADFRFVVQETYPPYALSVIAPAPAALALATDKIEYAIGLWRRCLAADNWPAYPARVCYAEPPAWEEAAWLEKEAREETVA